MNEDAALDAYREMVEAGELDGYQPDAGLHAGTSIEWFRQIPHGHVLLGMSLEDGGPIGWDMFSDERDHMLVVSDDPARAALILRTAVIPFARGVQSREQDFQVFVLSYRPERWGDMPITVIPIFENEARDTIHTLSSLTHPLSRLGPRKDQGTLVILDEFEHVSNWNPEDVENLAILLQRGPACHIKVLASSAGVQSQALDKILRYFPAQCRIVAQGASGNFLYPGAGPGVALKYE